MILTSTLAFYHVPKTAGSWTTLVLSHVKGFKEVGLKHATPAQEPPQGRRAFCVVRHPLDWLESYWRFREGGRGIHADPWFLFYGHKGHILDEIDRLGSPVFEEWVDRVITQAPGFVGRLFDTYVAPGARVLRRAKLRHQLAELLLEFGFPAAAEAALSLPPTNTSTVPNITWPLRLWRRAAEAESYAMDRWGFHAESLE